METYNFEIIKNKIKEKELNQRDIAKKLGIGVNTLSRALNNKTAFKESVLTKLLELLDLKIDDIAINKKDKRFFLIDEKDYEEIKSNDNPDLSFEQTKRYYRKDKNGKIFITKAGLNYKYYKILHGRGLSSFSEIPSKEEYDMYMKMHNLKQDNEGVFFLMKQKVVIDETEYVDYGTASGKLTNNSSALFYLACERALTNVKYKIANTIYELLDKDRIEDFRVFFADDDEKVYPIPGFSDSEIARDYENR